MYLLSTQNCGKCSGYVAVVGGRQMMFHQQDATNKVIIMAVGNGFQVES